MIPYPWLTRLWQQCESLHKPCGVILSGAPHSGLERCVDAVLQYQFKIGDPANHPDVMFLEGSGKAIGIDEVRDLVQFTHIKPTLLNQKYVIIQPFDALTIAAQQSFLKTLEESLVPTYFLMVTYNLNKILPTIKSRSQVFSMGEVSAESIQAYAAEAGLTFDENDTVIAQYAPLYHERTDYAAFKTVLTDTLQVCRSSLPGGSLGAAWDKISPDIQMAAMSLALTSVLKQDYHQPRLQDLYSKLIDLVRLQEKNQNINLSMHLDAIKMGW